MPFTDTFTDFYSNFKKSLADGTFAKLTFAKTIGNAELKNIYIRPLLEENTLKLELKFRFQKEELFEIYTIDKHLIDYYLLSIILFYLLFYLLQSLI